MVRPAPGVLLWLFVLVGPGCRPDAPAAPTTTDGPTSAPEPSSRGQRAEPPPDLPPPEEPERPPNELATQPAAEPEPLPEDSTPTNAGTAIATAPAPSAASRQRALEGASRTTLDDGTSCVDLSEAASGGRNLVAKLPKSIDRPRPKMCPAVRRGEVAGEVQLELVVACDGHVTRARVVSGLGHGCDELAIDAALATAFRPATLDDGTHAQVKLRYVIRYMMLE